MKRILDLGPKDFLTTSEGASIEARKPHRVRAIHLAIENQRKDFQRPPGADRCGAVPLQFAFFFNLDADADAVCDPADTTAGCSLGLAAPANVSGHELSEARGDPASPGAWYNSSGAENGDPCAWTFNVPSVTSTTATVGKLQREWSITAYTAGAGCVDSAGSKGLSEQLLSAEWLKNCSQVVGWRPGRNSMPVRLTSSS